MSATAALPTVFAIPASAESAVTALSGNVSASLFVPPFAQWPQLTLKPVTAAGYGQDPDLIATASDSGSSGASSLWPKLLTESQLELVAVLADIIVPAEQQAPSASEVGVPDVIDEWISAPYPQQQQHRALIEPGLKWMDDESMRRSGSAFVRLSESQQLSIVDDIAFSDVQTSPGLEMPGEFFSGLRSLVVGAYFTSPEGIEDLGYIGNTPISGDYPGPTPEARAHLEKLVESLGLSL